MISYRSDIDGLRTIAVAAVIMFHFSIFPFSGGYVGVDIFFVISGYLIGRSVIEKIFDSQFSLADFAEKRIRRLYPVLFVVTTVATFASSILLLPSDFREFGKSLIATAANVSNFQFYRESGYFDTGSINKPLLHTWSLAVEEQFYIALPLTLLAMKKIRLQKNQVYKFLLTLFLLSLIFSIYYIKYDQPAVFYLFFGRLWELGLGIIVAYTCNSVAIDSYKIKSAIAISALLVIGYCVINYDESTQFPGLNAIAPAMATAIIIAVGNHGDNYTSVILRNKFLVFTGLISYSLYLWHWPLFVFVNYYYVGEISNFTKFLTLIAIYLLSVLSWKFIEKPFRNISFLSKRKIYCFYAVCTIFTVISGIVIWKSNGIPQRYNSKNKQLALASGDFTQSQGICDSGPVDLLPGLHVCKIGRLDIKPSVLIWGDSHARAFRDGLDDEASQHGVSAILVWQGGCPPLIGIKKSESSFLEDKQCYDATKKLVYWIKMSASIKTVLLIGRWPYYTEGKGTGYDANNTISIKSDHSEESSTKKIFYNSLVQTVDFLNNYQKSVFILDPVPEIGKFNARKVAQLILTGRSDIRSVLNDYAYWPLSKVKQRQKYSLYAIDKISKIGRIKRISVNNTICKTNYCSAYIGGEILYYDNNHVSVNGSKYLKKAFDPVFTDK